MTSPAAAQGKPFQGRVALVTGGSRGIGKGIALELARQGCTVAFSYVRHHEEARKAQAAVEALGVPCLCHRANLAEVDDVKGLIQAVRERFGVLHILVNNAASGVQRPLLELEPKHWEWTMDVNARAAWLLAKEAVPIMPPGSSIVNISSLGSQRVLRNYFSVGTSKAALEAITRYLAVELGPLGIRANAISAGLVDTEALQTFPNRAEMLADTKGKTPAGRMVTERDVAGLVVFLCSPAAEMLRGQVIILDGGMSLLA
ncbi:MAG: enoyl-[acyl-carrier-protein] reductase FabL [Dehalococcoidia bacterium]|nr:enoyl-[acyl-carrier-protein] reductase FabL [Dehalococcoidia bacterium]